MRRSIRLIFAAEALAFCLLAAACAENPVILEVSLEQPGAMTFAGTDPDKPRLFVANTGQESLQVLELNDGLEDVSFVASKAIYFPLRIPSGPAPKGLAATEDGRFVAVLDWMTERLRLLDADSLTFAQADGAELEVVLGPNGAKPHSIVLLPGCGDGCSGRFAVSLEGAGAVSVLVVRESDETGVSVELEGVYDVGGSPGAIATSPTGQLLFVSDVASNDVVRLDVQSGTTDRIEVGGVPGSLAVSTDGRQLLVTRVAYRDVVVVGGLEGVMQMLDGNGRLAPVPKCLPQCDGAASAAEQCPGAHPADLALCQSEQGVQSAATGNYSGLYLGFVPSAVEAMGVSKGHPALDTPCCLDSLTNDETDACDEYAPRTWHEYFAIAGMDGNVVFVGVSGDVDFGRPELLSEGWCHQADLSVTEEEEEEEEEVASEAEESAEAEAVPTVLDPAIILTDCLDLPAERNRFECVRPEGDAFGIGFLPGRRAKTILIIEWEGTIRTNSLSLPELERGAGGGAIDRADESVYLSDTGVDLSAHDDAIVSREDSLFAGTCLGDDVLCGDIVEFINPLLDEPDCAEALGAEPIDGCSLERRILAVDEEEGGRLLLDRDVPDACLPQSGRIAYRVRAGDAYTASINGVMYRVRPGDRLGLGAESGVRESVAVGFRSTSIDYAAVGACGRYGEDGVLAGLPGFTRSLEANVTVYDALQDIRSGTESSLPAAYSLTVDLLYDADGRRRGVGNGIPQLHQGMAIYDANPEFPVIFNSYAASNALVGFMPTPAPEEDGQTSESSEEADAGSYTPSGREFRSSTWYGDTSRYRVIN